jgi:phospho-N-acetylmuramoyl-pentapeptide-transferase
MSEVVTRSLIAAGISLVISILIGPIAISNLRKLKAGQVIRDDGPKSHMKKSGTPSMGGVIIIVSLLLGSAAATPGYSMLPWALFITTGCGLVGMLDDYISIVSHRSLGLRARQKILFQLIFGLILGAWAYSNPNIGSEIIIPFSEGLTW